MQTEQEINSGNIHILKPRKALNKAFLKVKPNRSQTLGLYKSPEGGEIKNLRFKNKKLPTGNGSLNTSFYTSQKCHF